MKAHAVSLFLLGTLVSAPAFGQEPPPAPPPSDAPLPPAPPPTSASLAPAPLPPPAHAARLACCNKIASFGQVNDFPIVFGVIALNFGLALGAGIGLDYTNKPNPMSTTDPGRTDKTSVKLLLYGYFAAVNKPTWTTGPEFTAILNLSGYKDDPLHFWELIPAWGIFVAPFKAPLFFGTSLGVKILKVPGPDLTTVAFQTAGLRVGWLWR
jgi:hypothetical protein